MKRFIDLIVAVMRENPGDWTARDILRLAGDRFVSGAKSPASMIARDISMDIKLRGDASLFVRTGPGRFKLRAAAADDEKTR